MAVGNVVGNLVGNVVGNLVSGGFDPAGIFGSDLIAWYRGDTVTVSEPSPLDPNDLTTANWLRSSVSVVANQYTSTFDSVALDKVTANAVVATPTYVESAVAIANCNANYPNTVRICRVKYGNHAWIMLGGGTKHAYFNVQTGAVGTVNGGGSATITALGGGEYLCKYFAPTSGVNNKSLVHLVSGDNSGINWSPAGTEYVHMAGVYMEQKRCSQLTDLSGRGNHAVQAAAANQLSWSGTSFDGMPPPVTSLFARASAVSGMGAGSGLYVACVYKRLNDASYDAPYSGTAASFVANSGFDMFFGPAASPSINTQANMGGASTTNSGGSVVLNALEISEQWVSGTVHTVKQFGKSALTTACNAGGLTNAIDRINVGVHSNGTTDTSAKYELVVARVYSAAQQSQMRSYLQGRYGVAP